MRVLTEDDLAERPSADGRAATVALRASLDAVVVVGCLGPGGVQKRPKPVIHLRGAADLDARWFLGVRTVALFAGPFVARGELERVRRALHAMP